QILPIYNELQDMLAGGERHGFFADPLEVVPAAGVRQDNATGQGHTVDLDVIGGIGEIQAGCRPQLDVVIAACRHVDGVGEPLSGLGIAHGVAAAYRVGGDDEVHVLAEPGLAGLTALSVVIVGNAWRV